MICRVQALNYRAFRSLDLLLQTRHVLVGPNGSGKSTLLDVIAFAADVMRFGPDVAAFGDDRQGIEARVSDSRDLLTMRTGEKFEIVLEAQLPEGVRSLVSDTRRCHSHCRYELGLEVPKDGGIRICHETFWLTPESVVPPRPLHGSFPAVPLTPPTIVTAPGKKAPPGWRKVVNKVVESGNDYFQSETSTWNNMFRLAPDRSALGGLPQDEDKFPAALWFRRLVLERAQRIALNGMKLRLPGPSGSFHGLLSDGSNLANAVHSIEKDGPELDEWMDEVRTAIPDLDTVTTVERPEDRRRFLKARYRGGLEIPGFTMSDGTLRLLALTLLPFLKNLPAIIMIEEPENGIHPQGVETIYRALTTIGGTQTLCATHSTVLVNQATLEEILCFAKTADGVADVVKGSEHPRLREWIGQVDKGTLFASGILS